MQKYSVFSLIKNALKGHKDWEVAWKNPTPKSEYDVIIIGGGGHGLATAYYLAKEHNITNVAIVEKGWIGGGNVGRNTTIIRSNYMHDENGLFSEFGMDLWRNMSQELNFNVMAGVGVIAVTKINFPSFLSFKVFKYSGLIFAIYLPIGL